MRKTIVVLALVLIGGIVAVAAPSLIAGDAPDLTPKDKTITLEKANKTALESIDCGNPLISELDCTDKVCTARMTNQDQNVGCGGISIPRRYCSRMDTNCGEECECLEHTEYSNAELLDMRDTAIKKRLEGIAKATIERQAKAAKTAQLGSGEITINEKK